MKILITGVCGFIFSNFLKTILNDYPQYSIIGIDSCEEYPTLKNIIPNTNNYKFYLTDICHQKIIDNIFEIEKPDIIIHGAARSFVDSSIEDPMPFTETNVIGTQVLVNAAIKHKVKRFIYISTDEVYGSLGLNDVSWDELSKTIPSSPYSSSKLGGEHIVRAASKTYGLNYNITRCCNIYGENQRSRNLIPKIITSLLCKKTINLHDKGEPIREWMYIQDKISAILKILEYGKINETYNIGSGIEKKNIEVYCAISKIMNKSTTLNLDTIRMGQDFRYSVNCSKIKALGWKPSFDFDIGLSKCVNWYLENKNHYD